MVDYYEYYYFRSGKGVVWDLLQEGDAGLMLGPRCSVGGHRR